MDEDGDAVSGSENVRHPRHPLTKPDAGVLVALRGSATPAADEAFGTVAAVALAPCDDDSDGGLGDAAARPTVISWVSAKRLILAGEASSAADGPMAPLEDAHARVAALKTLLALDDGGGEAEGTAETSETLRRRGQEPDARSQEPSWESWAWRA